MDHLVMDHLVMDHLVMDHLVTDHLVLDQIVMDHLVTTYRSNRTAGGSTPLKKATPSPQCSALSARLNLQVWRTAGGQGS